MATVEFRDHECTGITAGIGRSLNPGRRDVTLTLVIRQEHGPSHEISLWFRDAEHAGEIATALNKIAAGEVVA